MHEALPDARTSPVTLSLRGGPPWAFAQPAPVVLSDDLNEQQREAITHLRGPLLVLAPVGTGKTTVIAHRAVHAIRSGIEPARILCLSFTNRAAREMRDRILTLLGARAGEVTVRTFHGFCTQVLRHEADALGIPADFTICDEEDAKEILLDLARRQGALPDPAGKLGEVLLKLVERMKLSLLGSGPLTPYPSPPRGEGRIFAPPRPQGERGRGEGEGHDATALLWALADEADPVVRAALPRLDPDRLLADFNAALSSSGSLDFSDLILCTDRLFAGHPDRLARWQTLHPWVQVDEVQDTNLPEYHILARLAEPSRDLAFFGDIDQTIYEWRGSDPFRTLAEFKRRFDPVREIALTKNYRSSRDILQACEALIRAHPHAVTQALVSESEDTGRRIVVHAAQTLQEEGRWIASTLLDLTRQGVGKRQIAILVRANHTAVELSRVLAAEKVDHFLVDKVRFFRQAEVKDALAYVRFLLNPYDAHSLLRMLRRPVLVNARTVEAVRSLPPEAGLRLVDFADPRTAEYVDPFGLLLRRYAEGRVVVFDVESTGLDVTRDDVVELAAQRVGTHGATGEFHALLRTTRPLEDSSRIHGITAAVLDREGGDPADVYDKFLSFLDGCIVVGHNVGYDVNIVRSQMRRLGRRWPDSAVPFDTLDLCRRFFRLPSYTLANVCRDLRLPSTPTHRAADDVRTTWHLLQRLVGPLLTMRSQRERFVAQYAPEFAALNEKLRRWRTLLDIDRPVFVLEKVLDESGLREHWGHQENGKKRLANLLELARLFGIYDDATLAPREALLNVVHLAALGNELDRYVEGEEKVYLLTVHQAKGLEFDTVFIAGATDRQFPSARSEKEGRLDEEHRLFYVAMTRARRRLFISHHLRDDRDKPQQPSRFLASIPECLRHPL